MSIFYPRTSINGLTTGGQVMSARHPKDDTHLTRDNYPAAAAMKYAKTGCHHNGYHPCWEKDHECPLDDCEYSDYNERRARG